MTTWRGRRGTVALGPTQHRVACYLAELASRGQVTVRTADVAERCQLSRTEAFRIMARLRVLGLFGISNDRGGHHGGRRIWRTAIAHDGPGLDPVKHRIAWARMRAAAAWARGQVIATIRARRTPPDWPTRPARANTGAILPGGRTVDAGGPSFAERVFGPAGPPAWFTELAR